MNFDQQQLQAGVPSSPSPAGRRYNNTPSAPGGQLHRLNPAAQQASSVDTFYGLPYRVDEPAPQAVASSPSRAPIIAIEEDDDDASSVASASSVDGGEGETVQAMNRNARRPKNANHGKRPVSRISRREKKRSIGNHRR
jgi:hypothetical protein